MNYLSFGGICVPSRPHSEEKVVGEANITQSLCGGYAEKKLMNIAIQDVDFADVCIVGHGSHRSAFIGKKELLMKIQRCLRTDGGLHDTF